MQQNICSIISEEFDKWKEFEKNALEVFAMCKFNCKQEEELCECLKNKISALNETNSEITKMIQLEMYNEFTTTNDILKLGKLSNEVDISSDNIQKLLTMCNTLEQKLENNLKHLKAELKQEKITNEDALKLQQNEIVAVKEISCGISSSENESINSELDGSKNHRQSISNNLEKLLGDIKNLENDIYETDKKTNYIQEGTIQMNTEITRRNQLKESVLVAVNDSRVKTDEELNEISQSIANLQTMFKNTTLDISNSSKAAEEHRCDIANFFKQNLSLKHNAESFEKKIVELEKLQQGENEVYQQNCSVFEKDIKVCNEDLQNQEESLSKEREIQKTNIFNLDLLTSNLHKEQAKINALLQSVNRLKEEKITSMDLNNQEKQCVDTLSEHVLKNNERIANLETESNNLETETLNFTDAHAISIEKLDKELEIIKIDIDSTRKKIETIKRDHKLDIEKNEYESIAGFNGEQLKLENEIIFIRKSDNKYIEKIKELSIELESKTLECDILLRKIRTAQELQISLKNELKPKPLILNKAALERKRQVDETSDSSFDDSIPFYQRMLMKNKIKKAKK